MVAIAGLFLLWGNFHGEVVFGPLRPSAWWTVESLGRALAGGDVAAVFRSTSRHEEIDPTCSSSSALSCSASSTPNGLQVLLYPLRLARFLFVGGVPLEMGSTSPAPRQQPCPLSTFS